MAFNFKNHRISMENLDGVPGNELETSPENEIFPSRNLNNEPSELVPPKTEEIPNFPYGKNNNFEQIEQAPEPDASQTNVSQSAMLVSERFKAMMDELGLDQLPTIMGAGNAQQEINNIINKTIEKIEQKLGVE